MLKEEKLDVFLDAFLDGKKPAQETDLDFWDEKSEPEKNDFWEAQDVLTAPKHKGKLSKRIYVFDFNFNSGYNLDWNYAF